MKYISGFQALNTHLSDVTCGDWHPQCLDVEYPCVFDTDDSVLGAWDVHDDILGVWDMFVAGHMRACLDLVVDGKGRMVQGMQRDFIVNEDVIPEIFGAALLLCRSGYNDVVYEFMCKEYKGRWIRMYRECFYET